MAGPKRENLLDVVFDGRFKRILEAICGFNVMICMSDNVVDPVISL